MTSPAIVIISKLKNDASVGIVHDTQIPTINYLLFIYYLFII